jgi:hypothetical protein
MAKNNIWKANHEMWKPRDLWGDSNWPWESGCGMKGVLRSFIALLTALLRKYSPGVLVSNWVQKLIELNEIIELPCEEGS